MHNLKFERAISEIIQEAKDGHPFLTVAKFIFTDDKPNSNNQAISVDEFDSIIASAVGMPIKMRFDGAGATKHPGSIPIGVIRAMEKKVAADGSNQLIAEAVLWNDEYPDEVAYLKETFADGKAPGVSWELGYKSSIIESGVTWLKNVITRAATFVKSPAYGTRTALLALASMNDPEDIKISILALAEELTKDKLPPVGNKGGKQGMTEEEIKKLQEDLKKAQAETETLKTQVTEKDKVIKANEEESAKLKKEALIATRVQKYSEAGFKLDTDTAKADKKKEMFVVLQDDQFEEYIADLKEAAKPKQPSTPAQLALASASAQNFPKPDTSDGDLNLKEFMRGLARPNFA